MFIHEHKERFMEIYDQWVTFAVCLPFFFATYRSIDPRPAFILCNFITYFNKKSTQFHN